MADVLLVSKAIAAPWNDSSRNLVRDLALGMTRYDPIVLSRRGASLELPRGRVERLFPRASGAFATPINEHLRVLGRLALGPRPDLWHFFFAPNPRTSRVGRLMRLMRRVPTVQTVCSAPREDQRPDRLLFADRTVVLSRHTERLFRAAGVPAGRLTRIAACVPPLVALTEGERSSSRRVFGLPVTAPVICYPGDLEFGGGAEVVLEAFGNPRLSDAFLVMACRIKTPRARTEESRLRDRAGALGVEDRVRWLGETSRIHALIGAVDVVALPSASLYAKMDHPLVLLEAMSLERPVIVSEGTPAEELASGGALVVHPSSESVAETLTRLLSDEGWRRSLGERGRDHVRTHHRPDVMARAYESLYDEVRAEAG